MANEAQEPNPKNQEPKAADNGFLFADFAPNGEAPTARSVDLPFPGVVQPNAQLTVRQVIESYRKLGCGRYAKRALDERQRYWRQFCDDLVDYPGAGLSKLGERPVAHCRQIDLLQWVAAHPEWKNDWTIRGIINMVQRPFNWAARGRLIPDNPFLGVSHPEGDPRRPMTDAEFAALLRGTRAIFRRVIVFMAVTGCRTHEMADLIWPWVDWARGCLVIPKRYNKTGKKTRKPRIVPLTVCALKLLAWLRDHDGKGRRMVIPKTDGHVLLNARGTRWNRCNLSLRMRRLREKAGIPEDCYLYGTRHRFGTNWIKAGGNLKQLSKAMGHTSTAITERMYVDIDGEIDLLREGAEAATRRRR